MTAEQLRRLEREAGRYTGPSGRPVVILGADEFDALVAHAKALQAFADDVLQAGFIEGLTERQLLDFGVENGILDLPALPTDAQQTTQGETIAGGEE